jgi:hypothetical protein
MKERGEEIQRSVTISESECKCERIAIGDPRASEKA